MCEEREDPSATIKFRNVRYACLSIGFEHAAFVLLGYAA